MPTPTSPSSNRQSRNTRSYSHSASSPQIVWKAEACGARIDLIVPGSLATRKLSLRAGAGTRAAAPFSANGIRAVASRRTGLPSRRRTLLGQSRCQRRCAPMVFGFIPECRSASSRISVRLRQNAQFGPDGRISSRQLAPERLRQRGHVRYILEPTRRQFRAN